MFRLTILHAAGSVDWNLQISDVNPQDSGEYECQVVYVVLPDIRPYLDGHVTSAVDWNLQISGVNPQGSGEYECQVVYVV